MNSMKPYTLFVLCLVMLAAVACDDETPESTAAPEPTRPPYVLRADALPQSSGPWQLVADSVALEEREAGLILSAEYAHAEKNSAADLLLTVYRDPEQAVSGFDERVAAWQADPDNTVEAVSAFGDGAYLLNDGAEGIALVSQDSTLVMGVDTSQITRLEALNLMQIGLTTLRFRDERQNAPGTLGQATLAPPPTESR